MSSPLHLSCGTGVRELNRCSVIQQPFDLSKVQSACQLFVGTWDFSTFMKSSGEEVEPPHRVKTIKRFSVSPEIIKDSIWDCSHNLPPPYEIYNFTVEGSGFLRRQVCRM